MIVNGYTFNKAAQWHFDYLKEHYTDKLADLEKALGLTDETIHRMLKALGIKRERLWRLILPKTDEVNKDLANPYLSHVKIAKKYNTTPDVVAQRRKRAGLAVRRCVSRTILEEQIASILDNLDIAYHEQKRIGNWSIDFYLGNKIAIDVNGEWTHSKEIVKDRDQRKNIELSSLGYLYIEILEKEIEKARDIIISALKGKLICKEQ